jgi:hypothetical protein
MISLKTCESIENKRFNLVGSSYIDFGSICDFEYYDTFSFDFWIFINSEIKGDTVIFKRCNMDKNMGFKLVMTDLRSSAFIISSSYDEEIIFSGPVLGIGKWIHLVIVYDNKSVTFIRDNIEIPCIISKNRFFDKSIVDKNAEFHIETFNGKIKDLMVLKDYLIDLKIFDVRYKRVRLPKISPNPVGHWNFNDVEDGMVIDTSVRENHLKISEYNYYYRGGDIYDFDEYTDFSVCIRFPKPLTLVDGGSIISSREWDISYINGHFVVTVGDVSFVALGRCYASERGHTFIVSYTIDRGARMWIDNVAVKYKVTEREKMVINFPIDFSICKTFSGEVESVSIYKKVLDDVDILYSTFGHYPIQYNIYARWPMNPLTGNVDGYNVYDTSGNGRDGILFHVKGENDYINMESLSVKYPSMKVKPRNLTFNTDSVHMGYIIYPFIGITETGRIFMDNKISLNSGYNDGKDHKVHITDKGDVVIDNKKLIMGNDRRPSASGNTSPVFVVGYKFDGMIFDIDDIALMYPDSMNVISNVFGPYEEGLSIFVDDSVPNGTDITYLLFDGEKYYRYGPFGFNEVLNESSLGNTSEELNDIKEEHMKSTFTDKCLQLVVRLEREDKRITPIFKSITLK